MNTNIFRAEISESIMTTPISDHLKQVETIKRLSQSVAKRLQYRNISVTTAESCTGGAIATAITEVAGSSQWFEQGFITYSNTAKQALLGVKAELIQSHGAVSQAVVEAMATGALSMADAGVSVAVSGIAGPGGGSRDKPVGTVWIAYDHYQCGVSSQCFLLAGDRQRVRSQAVIEALKGLERLL